MRFAMKRLTKVIGIAVLLLLVVQVASATFTINSMQINPSGTLLPGTPVSVAFQIQLDSSNINDMELYTSLDQPKWSYVILVNSIQTAPGQATTKTLDISSFLLTYKSGDIVAIGVSLDGNAPSVQQTTNQTLIQVSELGTTGGVIASTQYVQTALVINTADVTTAISGANSQLADFRTQIDEKAAMDVDTSSAEASYNDAKTKIDAAQALPTTQYTTALSYITAAQTSITNGETLLDKSWAEKEVSDAQVPINNVDSLINYFQGNKSTADDPKLSPIISKREVAASYISAANDAISTGNYVLARSKATDAFAKGNESYNDALTFKKQVESGFNPFAAIGGLVSSSVLVVVVGVIAVALIIVGVIIYRKRSRWDELG